MSALASSILPFEHVIGGYPQLGREQDVRTSRNLLKPPTTMNLSTSVMFDGIEVTPAFFVIVLPSSHFSFMDESSNVQLVFNLGANYFFRSAHTQCLFERVEHSGRELPVQVLTQLSRHSIIKARAFPPTVNLCAILKRFSRPPGLCGFHFLL